MNGNKKIYIMMVMLIAIGAGVYYIKLQLDKASSEDIVAQVKNNTIEINKTQRVVNATKDVVQNLSFNQNISIQNQKVLAKGINTLGNIIIPKIEDTREKANLLDDIKFGVDKILNKTEVKNITLGN
jgi:hypothetical protein